MLTVKVNRDGASFKDDLVGHEAAYEVASGTTVSAFLKLLQASYLAPAGFSELTWVASSSVRSRFGVVAIQLLEPLTQVPIDTTLDAYFEGKIPAMFFDCWHQSDPHSLYQGLVEGNIP